MKQKRVCLTEMAYVLGILILAAGTALMELADFGMSMVVAPAYLLHLKVSQVVPAFSFGMSEYVLQAVLLIALGAVMRRFRMSYLFSFVTAVIYGFTLDLAIFAASALPCPGILWRCAYYVLGMVLCSLGVAFLFHTYIAPEAYELVVKEISAKTGARLDRVKTVYDCCSCALGVALSFAFFGFGHFEGVKAGTIFCALINGFLIGRISLALENAFDFKDALPLRGLFSR